MIVGRFCENGGDVATAIIPVLEVAERFVMVLPGLLAREAAKPGSPLAGFAIIGSLSQIKSQLRRTVSHPYESMLEAIKLLNSADSAQMQLGLAMLDDMIQMDQQLRQPVIDILCAFLTTSNIPTDWSNEAESDDYRWIRGQVALEELIWNSIPLAATGPNDVASNLTLDLTGARVLNLNLVGREVDRLKLDGAIVYGNALFTGCRVTGSASFEKAEFHGVASFERTSFEGPVAFTRTRFYCSVDLGGSCFSDSVGFRSTNFEDDFIIGVDPDDHGASGSTNFNSDVTFYDVGCGGRMSLDKVNCSGNVLMSRSNILGTLSLRNGHFLNGLTISEVSATDDITLEGAHVMGELRLSLTEFGEVDLVELRAGASQDIYVDEIIAAKWVAVEQNSRSTFR